MTSRLKSLGLGSKRKSSSNTSLPQQTAQPQLGGRPGTPSAASSTTSLPMNPNAGGRPPSYTPGYPPGVAPQNRTTSPPMAQGGPGPRTPPSHVMGGPPPINTATAGSYGPPPQQMQQPPGGIPPPGAGGPPQYTGAPYPPPGQQGMAPVPYANRPNAVEVEGAGRSKSQLIVGIDFVSFSTPRSQ